MAWIDDAARLLPTRVDPAAPFYVTPPAVATCASALEKPIQLGNWTNTKLEPFDDAELLSREISEMRWCVDKPEKPGGPPVVKECAACDYGYQLPKGGVGPLECRGDAACGSSGGCKDCVMTALTPWLIVPCESCISYGCSPETGRCSCFSY